MFASRNVERTVNERKLEGIARNGVLSMYREQPEGELSLEEFERLAIDRIQVLRGIKDVMDRGKKAELLTDTITKLLAQHMSSGGNAQAEDMRRKDLNSHYVCRIAFCRTPDDRSWFLSAETELFRYRMEKELAPSVYPEFLAAHGFSFETLSRDEGAELAPELVAVLQQLPGIKLEDFIMQHNDRTEFRQEYYRVPFEDVPDLVRERKVLLRRGWAIVPRAFLTSLIVVKFRSQLSRQMADMNRRWTSFASDESDRLVPLVERIKSARLQGEVDLLRSGKVAMGIVNARDVDSVLPSFPLCMYNLYQELKSNRHLKHKGRLQLGLFLKGIGMPMEESLVFWRSMFAPRTTDDKFQKEYAYNIRHNYGKEGNRKDYKPHNCLKIIAELPPGNDPDNIFGCPFRYKEEAAVRAMLSALKVAPGKITDALALKKEDHFQLACAAAFEGVHGCSCESGVNHPNTYFEESRKIILEREREKEAGTGAAAAAAAQGGATGGLAAAGVALVNTPAPGKPTMARVPPPGGPATAGKRPVPGSGGKFDHI